MPTCPHGFPQGECLICKTLGTGPGQSKATKVKERHEASPATQSLLSPALGSPALATRAKGASPVTADAGGGGRRRGRGAFWAVLGALVVGGLLVWAFAGVVSFAFHVAEYVALAVAAGWVGYKLGYARGRRHRRQA